MDIENKIIKEFSDYIKEKSIFKDTIKVVPDTPESFATFPTIVIKEAINRQNTNATSTNYYEYADDITYQVEIYTKNVTINNVKYQSRNVLSELRLLVCNFFMNCGFERTDGTRGNYPDESIKRYIMLFRGSLNSWNMNIR